MKMMTPKERLIRAARGQDVDRVPSIGGWINGVKNLAVIAGISVEQYLADPLRALVGANRALRVDGMVNPVIPRTIEQIRTGACEESQYGGIEAEALLDHAASLPDTENEVRANFDPAAVEGEMRRYFESAFRDWNGIVPIPNFWDIGGHFPLYHTFGYTAFLSACALYPEAVGKIWWARSLRSREKAKILVKLYREYELVPLMFCGEDLCNNQGPMASPEFLREHYLPTVQLSIEPLVDAGIRLVHHCDGDVRPLVNDFLRIGFSGFQGFQYELGVDPWELRKLRSARGEELIFFMGMSVSRTMPFGTIHDVRQEVDYFMDVTDGGRGMFLFSANVIGVEVPVENTRAAYARVHERPFRPVTCMSSRKWPWALSHPENRFAEQGSRHRLQPGDD